MKVDYFDYYGYCDDFDFGSCLGSWHGGDCSDAVRDCDCLFVVVEDEEVGCCWK